MFEELKTECYNANLLLPRLDLEYILSEISAVLTAKKMSLL